MPDFPKPPSRPSSAPGLGGVTLRPEPAAILRACGRVGPLFVLTRNQACIFGAVADPLRTLDRPEGPEGPLAGGGAITLNLARRREVAAYGYLEAGPRGGFIDAIEFCAPGGVGFLKLCRMDGTSRERWLGLLADFQTGGVAPADIDGLQKTNHLNVPSGPTVGPTAASPAEALLERFFDLVVRWGAEMHVTAPVGGGRARLDLAATHRVRAGEWMVLSSNETAWHLAPGAVRELRVITRPHVALLVLLGDQGRLLARVLVRHRAVLAAIPEIL